MSYIGKVKIDSGDYLPIGSTLYGVCSSSAAAYEKSVTLSDFDTPINGVTIHVKFTNGNTASLTNPSDASEHLTLKVGSTTAAQVSNPGGTIAWSAGAIISFTYEENVGGTNYWIVNDGVVTTFDASGLATSDHTHGYISNNGKLGTASVAVVTDENKNITTANLSVSDPTAVTNTNNTVTDFISNISQNAIGQISVTKTALPVASTTTTGIIQIGFGATDALAGNSSISIAGNTVNLAGGSITAATLRTSLDLSTAMHFRGKATVVITEGSRTNPTITGYTFGTNGANALAGDVVLDKDSEYEYVWTVDGTSGVWEKLGSSSSYALASAVLTNTGTKGDLVYWSDTDTASHLAIGTGNNKFLTISNGVPAWGAVGKSDVGLGNVTNDAQVPKSIGTTAGDIIYWSGANTPARLGIGTAGQVLTVNSSGLPAWQANSATDENVKQTLDSSSTDTFPLLFSTSKTSVTTVDITSTTKRNNSIYIKPSNGTLYAAYFNGDGSAISNLAWANINNKPIASSTLGLVKTTSTVSTFTDYTAAPIDSNGVVYYKDTNSHYTANLWVTGSNSGTAKPNAAVTNGNVYLRLIEESNDRGTYKIAGATGISVTAAATSGDISISTRLQDISFTNAPTEATAQASIGFVYHGVLYLKKFAT